MRTPWYVGDSTITGAPCGARPRRAADSPAWPPGTTSTSAASTPIELASAARSAGMPLAGERSQAPGRRTARVIAASSARVGCRSGAR
jgi:hypothetical protein